MPVHSPRVSPTGPGDTEGPGCEYPGMDLHVDMEDIPDLPPAYNGPEAWPTKSGPPADEKCSPMDKKKDPLAGLTQKEKDLLEEYHVTEWNEFTQNTTFHGVKYIFEESPFRLRR